MITIGITGTLGAGKGTVVEYLTQQKDFSHYSVSGFLGNELNKKGVEINRDNLVDLGNKLREKYGPSFIVKKLFTEAKKKNANTIIESIRNPKEAEFLKNQKNSYLIAVDANSKTRYDRIKKRSGPKDRISYQKFISQEKREMNTKDPNKIALAVCISMADYKIENNSSLNSLYKQIEEVINKVENK